MIRLELTCLHATYTVPYAAVHFGLLVWSTGLAPNPLIQSISEIEKDSKTSRYVCRCSLSLCLMMIDLFTRSLYTNDALNVIMKDGQVNPDVYAIGDAAIIKGELLPATAQGKYVDNLL